MDGAGTAAAGLRVDAPAVPAGTRTAVLKNAPANRSTEKRLNWDYLRSAGRGVAQQLEVERDGQGRQRGDNIRLTSTASAANLN